MDSFDRFRLLRQALQQNNEVPRWLEQLKRCYPLPEWALADLLYTDLRQLWRWRTGRNQPRKMVVGLMAYLIGFRIGILETSHDLLEIRSLMATGELEKMVDDFLAAEAKAEAKEALRYARSRGEL